MFDQEGEDEIYKKFTKSQYGIQHPSSSNTDSEQSSDTASSSSSNTDSGSSDTASSSSGNTDGDNNKTTKPATHR